MPYPEHSLNGASFCTVQAHLGIEATRSHSETWVWRSSPFESLGNATATETGSKISNETENQQSVLFPFPVSPQPRHTGSRDCMALPHFYSRRFRAVTSTAPNRKRIKTLDPLWVYKCYWWGKTAAVKSVACIRNQSKSGLYSILRAIDF